MLGIIEQWNEVSGCHMNNTARYLFLMFIKLGMDVMVLHLCYKKLCTSFLSMCSVSIVLADLVLVFFIGSVWFLGPERNLVSLCFILAHASTAYGALPLPMMCLGLLDYSLENICLSNKSTFCKFLRNAVLTVLVWALAVTWSFVSVKSDLVELHNEEGVAALMCEIEESVLITYFDVVLCAVIIFQTLPFWSMIPGWVKEADRLSEAREEQENQSSDLLFTKTTESKSSEETYLKETFLKETYLKETVHPCPPLWLSLTLSFGLFWMPYLVMSVACLICGFGVPAYISVNLLWLECTNSFLMGVVFFVNSETRGPYSKLPENVCSWHVYWHLSKGKGLQQLSTAVLNASKGKREILLYNV